MNLLEFKKQMDIKSENISNTKAENTANNSEDPDAFMARHRKFRYILDKPTNIHNMFLDMDQSNHKKLDDSSILDDLDGSKNDTKVPDDCNIEVSYNIKHLGKDLKYTNVKETIMLNEIEFTESDSFNSLPIVEDLSENKICDDKLIDDYDNLDDEFIDDQSNEQLGIIYEGTSPSGKKYIGQHGTLNFSKRLSGHIQSYHAFIRNLEKKENGTLTTKYPHRRAGCVALYNAFKKYTPESFKWKILESNIPLDKLNERENHYIITLDTMGENGYNLKLNDSHSGHKMYSQETLDQMSKSHKISRTRDLDKYRENKEQLEGLPKHVTYYTKENGIHGYRLVNHPNCYSKEFIGKLSVPFEELKQKMIDFLATIETTRFRNERQRKWEDTGVPEGIVEMKPGRFLVRFNFKSIQYIKYFSQEPREKALKLAIEWLENKKKEIGWVKRVKKPRKRVNNKTPEIANGTTKEIITQQKYVERCRSISPDEPPLITRRSRNQAILLRASQKPKKSPKKRPKKDVQKNKK